MHPKIVAYTMDPYSSIYQFCESMHHNILIETIQIIFLDQTTINLIISIFPKVWSFRQ